MKKSIVITGGAGFVGTNLIKYLLEATNFNIISLDNYSSGSKSNHQKNRRVRYLRGDTKDINKIFKKPKKIHTIFHFGEFSRIYQSFLQMEKCLDSNTVGTNSVFNYCLTNKIKLVYSATSASLGNKGRDRDLSPYAFTKAKNLEMLDNFKKWFNFRFEIIYFYNVYGPNQICKGKMATVIGIFEDSYKKKKPLPVVRPGTQSRRFTHIKDTVKVCYMAWKKDLCRHYSIYNKKSYSIYSVARMFKSKIKFLPQRRGERYASALASMNLLNKVHKIEGKINLKNYINTLIKKY